MAKGRNRRKRRHRFREPIGRLEPEALLIHRDLEFLRAAGGRHSAKRQHVRGGKYLEARRIAERGRK